MTLFFLHAARPTRLTQPGLLWRRRRGGVARGRLGKVVTVRPVLHTFCFQGVHLLDAVRRRLFSEEILWLLLRGGQAAGSPP